MSHRLARLEHWITIGLIVGLCTVPLVGLIVAPSNVTAENRRLDPFPRLGWNWQSIRLFPTAFTRYFNDHLGFRQSLVGLQASARVKLLGAPTSPFVSRGLNGWLGYIVGDASAFTPDELEAWTALVAARSNWLRARGIPYLFVLVPDKQAVYPEFFPGEPIAIARRARLDLLMGRLTAAGVHVLDLRVVLAALKTDEPLFFKTDTHWNTAGAHAAYEAILGALRTWRPDLQPLAASEISRDHERIPWGDLATMLGLPGQLPEVVPRVRLKTPRHRLVGDLNVPGISTTEMDNPAMPRLVMYRDSFAVTLAPFLAQHFSKAMFIWDPIAFDPAHITMTRPDVVIQEVVERTLAHEPPPDDLRDRELDTGTATAGLVGYQGDTDCTQMLAWAWDALAPETAVRIDIYDGERRLATVPADVYRADLKNMGIGDGRHGLVFPTPEALRDGLPHRIRMTFAGTQKPLGLTMRTITCGK